MRLNSGGPGGLATDPALNTDFRTSSYPARSRVQEHCNTNETEQALLVAAWGNPGQFARLADAFALHISDFHDRLAGVIAGYLRICGETGRRPTLAEAEAMLRECAVLHNRDELAFLITEPAPRGESLADLMVAVQRAAMDRSEQLFRELTRDAWRAMVRGLNCPHCRGRQSAKHGGGMKRRPARRVVYA